eukprot:scaffold77634_cov100-Phaeocystis_antarctica.AAC.1
MHCPEPTCGFVPAFRVTGPLSPPLARSAPSCDARGAVALPSHSIATSLSVTSDNVSERRVA